MEDTATADIGRETNEVVSAVNGVRDAVRAAFARVGRFVIGLDDQTHVRMVVDRLVFSVTAAGTFTLMVGNQPYVYNIGANGPFTVDVPAPVTIVDRGVQITGTAGAGAALSLAYLTYKPE